MRAPAAKRERRSELDRGARLAASLRDPPWGFAPRRPVEWTSKPREAPHTAARHRADAAVQGAEFKGGRLLNGLGILLAAPCSSQVCVHQAHPARSLAGTEASPVER